MCPNLENCLVVLGKKSRATSLKYIYIHSQHRFLLLPTGKLVIWFWVPTMGEPRFFSHEPRNHLRTKASLAAIDKLLHQMMDNHRYPRNSTILLMAKIRRSPVEVGSLSHYRVLAPSKQWLGMGFLKHQLYLLTIPT